jgi:mRNA interferase RelE/StbE
MQTAFNQRFSKDIDRLADEATRRALADLIEKVEVATSLVELPGLKKLRGHKSAYRLRLGDYRVGIFAVGGVVEFARVVHRRDIYRVFP